MRFPERWQAVVRDTAAECRRRPLVLWVLVLGALGLRLGRLAFQPLWWDEGWSAYFGTVNLGTMLRLTAVDIHPPLYYLLLHLWTGVFGPSPLALRLLSVLIGAATVPILYATARRLPAAGSGECLGRSGGLLAAALLAISPLHIYYSQEVRMYGLVTLLGLAATYLTLRWPWGEGRRRWPVVLGYILAAAAALYTQYYAAFLLLALNLLAFARWRAGRHPARALLPWLGAQAAVAALFAPWAWYVAGKLLAYVRFKVGIEGDLPLSLGTYLGRHLAAFTWGHAEGVLADRWWLGLLPLALMLPGLLLSLRRGPGAGGARDGLIRTAGVPLLLLATLLGCGFAVNLVLPFNPARGERLLLLGLPAYLLLLTAVLLAWWRGRTRALPAVAAAALVAVAALSLGFFYTVPRYPDDDYRPLAADLRARALPGDAVICVHPWQVGYLVAYIPDRQARPALVLTPRAVLPRERQLWAEDPGRLAADLDDLLARHGRLWLADHRTMGRVLESQIEAYLAEQAYPVLGDWYGSSTVLSLFAAGQPVAQGIRAQFGDWLTLEEAALDPDPLPAGEGVLAANLTWRLLAQPAGRYHVTLRLTGSSGRTWAQRDSAPGGGLADFAEWPVGVPQNDRHGLLIPAGTPPGDYQVSLQLYRSEDLAVLPAVFAGGSGGEVRLGSVRVVRPQHPPAAEALEIDRPLRIDYDGRLRLLGFTLQSAGPLQPGEAVAVDLYWQALAAPSEDLLPRLQLLDAGGAGVAERAEKPVEGSYPTAWWQAGELVRDPHALPIPAAVPSGRYRLAYSLIRAADGAVLVGDRGQRLVDLAEIEVQSRPPRYEPTSPANVQAIQFGPAVELAGYDLSATSARPGQAVAVTLHWHALATPDKNYYAFVHLLAADGRIVAQHDGTPGEGELPALGWLPGEWLVDRHAIDLPPDLPAGEYRLAAGLYDPASGERLGERAFLNQPLSVGAGK